MICNWIKSYKENGDKVIDNKYNINEVKFISSNNNYGVLSLLNYLSDRNINTSYILGLSNSGKSTLLNKIIDITNTAKVIIACLNSSFSIYITFFHYFN